MRALTTDQRSRFARSYRKSAILFGVAAAAWALLGAFQALFGSGTLRIFGYVSLSLAVLNGVISWRSYTAMKSYTR